MQDSDNYKHKWGIYRGTGRPAAEIPDVPAAPPWRTAKLSEGNPHALAPPSFSDSEDIQRAEAYKPHPHTVEMVNAAIYLRRPLLVTGKPGSGKSTLAYSLARELALGPVLRWNITSRSTLRDALYAYDALARLNDYSIKQPKDIGEYFSIGPLGTALLPHTRPRVILIDEIDKCDIDLPNDLLHVLDEGEYTIPELFREGQTVPAKVWTLDKRQVDITGGRISCREFPLVIMTSNGERDFPAPFLRRCLRVTIPRLKATELAAIVDAHLPGGAQEQRSKRMELIEEFFRRSGAGDLLSMDQLFNAVFLTVGAEAAFTTSASEQEGAIDEQSIAAARKRLVSALMRSLNSIDTPEAPVAENRNL